MSREAKTRIMKATIEEFNDKGIKFTMDDLAKRLGMSKKTIYALFKDKESLFLETVDYCFENIKASEAQIIENDELDIIEKISRVFIVLPEPYQDIDWRKLHGVKDKFPSIYAKIEKRLESEWEAVIELINQGIKEGKIKPIAIPVVKAMIEATIEHFLTSTILIDNGLDYTDALNEMISIIMEGISIK